MKVTYIFAAALAFAAGMALSQQQLSPEEQQKRKDAQQRTASFLSPEERAHLQANGKINRQQWMADHPVRESTGLIPLPDLGTGIYKGEQGGLYPGGVNTPPPAHLKAGLALAKKIVPLDAEGHPASDGRIVMISIGMSNTTMKFQAFQKLAKEQHDLNPKLLLVDGAQGSQVGWITSKPNTPFWDVVNQRLSAAGVTPAQVQAAWMLQANPGPQAEFPTEMRELQRNMVDTLHNMHDKFPNLKMTYLSSRTYAGYATSPLNPEPHAYENGFAVKWVVSDQIGGKPEMNYDPAKGPVSAPWVAWGPYVWADGVKPSKSGLFYVKEDYGDADGTHPSMSGRMKVATRLMEFMKTDATTKGWFLAQK
ncbi:MAG TPA: hypothetical protein VGL72_14980 [Bryobacteraceae bacterium]|jgi:hypothetical protein